MPEVKLKFEEKEFFLGSGIVTLGRTPENSVSFPNDSNVSRFHAEIEQKGEEYCLIDLNSSNGTTVNGQSFSGEHYLSDGDVIALGGSAELVFEHVKSSSNASHSAGHAGQPVTPAAETTETPGDEVSAAEQEPTSAKEDPENSKTMLFVAGGVFGLALVFGVGAGIYYFMSPSSCGATANIVSPLRGEVISEPTEVRVDLENDSCVEKIIFQIDDMEFAASDSSPFTASIDPAMFGDLADGFDHPLNVVLVDAEGNRIPQGQLVPIAFETRAVAKPTPGSDIVENDDEADRPSRPVKPAGPSLIEINEMAKNLLKQFSGGEKYIVSNRQFLQEVQRKIPEYAQDGYFEKAANYRDAISVAFVREQNLDASLGFILAMSRSKFDPAAKGQEIGLWRMTESFATEQKYTGLCGTQTIADPSQHCAANTTALYMKALVMGVFESDSIYGAVVFGKSAEDASAWKESLPENRNDLWNSIKTPAEREQLVRFFAAGIVAENPQKFGLDRDKPLSELYRLTL